jgi:hypothetical protein
MNERIRQLAEQATSTQGPTPYNPLTFEVFDREKFAELIVKECADIGALYADGNYEVYNQIIAHFGVEE